MTKLRTIVASAALALAAAAASGTPGAGKQQAKLTAADAAGGDHLGGSAALSGDTAVVGTADKDSHRGAVYVFRRTGAAWAQEAKLTASDAAADDTFGTSVAIEGDTVLVGAIGKSSDRGAVYVFTRTGAAWTQQAKLSATGGLSGDRFGGAVAIAGDTAVTGATGVGNTVGAVYVFTRSGAVWTQQAKLTASDAADGDALGGSVAISGDTAVAGAYGVGSLVGAAYVFVRTGTSWTQEARLAAPAPVNGDMFGRAVAVVGATAVIGAQGADSDRGAAHVFTRAGTTWTHETALTAGDAAENDHFAASVAFEGDRLLAGAHGKYLSQGAVYGFTRAGVAWTQTSKLMAADGTKTTFFGLAVSLSGDTALASAFGDDGDRGAAYAFDLNAGAAPPPGYCIATKVKTKLDARKPEKSTLTVTGILDTGTETPDFSGAAAFDVGGLRVAVPEFVAKGKTLRHVAEGVALTIMPAKNGSSRAAFSLKLTGEIARFAAPDGPLPFCFTNAAHRLIGTAKLRAGALGPHAVAAPGVSVLAAAATVKGAGKDSLALKLSFPGDGVVPAAAEDLTIGFGGTYTSPLLPAASFVRKGNAWVRTAKGPGITKATVDRAKGTITIAGAGLDLGAFAAGGNAVAVTVTLGSDTRSVAIRMALAGKKLSY